MPTDQDPIPYPENRIDPTAAPSTHPETQGSGLGPALPFLQNPIVLVVLTVLALVAAAVTALPTAGVALPPWALVISGLVSAICAALGIASPGIRKK